MSSVKVTLNSTLPALLEKACNAVKLRASAGTPDEPKAWYDKQFQEGAMKRLYQGAVICIDGEHGKEFSHVPVSGSIVRWHDEEFEVRTIKDGGESGSWVKYAALAAGTMWQGALLPLAEFDRRVPQVAVDGAMWVLAPMHVDSDGGRLKELYGTTAAGESDIKAVSDWAKLINHPVEKWRKIGGLAGTPADTWDVTCVCPVKKHETKLPDIKVSRPKRTLCSLASASSGCAVVVPGWHEYGDSELNSLIAELGSAIARYREFVVFHSEFVLPVYLIAYHRYNGDQLLRTT